MRTITTNEPCLPVAVGGRQRRLALRITGPEFAPQVVTLTEDRSTIGSDEHCTLRLELPGIEPLHCLIECNRRRMVVHRCAEQAWLNNRPFEEALLVAGDRLNLGGVEIEVLPATLEPASPAPLAHAVSGRRPAPPADTFALEAFERQRSDWIAVQDAAESQLADSTQRLSDRLVEVEHRERLLDARQAELDVEAEVLESERARWEKSRREAEEAWVGQCTQWNAERAHFEAERATILARLAERELELSAREIELQQKLESGPGANR